MHYTIAEMAEAGRSTERAVRLWHSKGLLGEVERDHSYTRLFDAEHIRRARIIAAAQTVGWPLSRIRAYFAAPSMKEQANLVSDLFSANGFIKDVRELLERTETGEAWFDL